MTKDEALKLALEALEELICTERTCVDIERGEAAINFIEKCLANDALEKKAENARELGLDYEPEQEPVAWKTDDIELYVREDKFGFYNIPLYTHPPQRTWVGLTDEERIMCRSYDPEEAVAKTEAKLKEKNT